MTTEIVKEIVETEITYYIAEDGKRFKAIGDCIKYERNLTYTKLSLIESAPALDGYMPFGCSDLDSDNSYYWYRPKSHEEIKLLEDYYGAEIDDICVGEWICIEVGYDVDVWVHRLEEDIEDVIHILNALGYECEIKPKGEQSNCLV